MDFSIKLDKKGKKYLETSLTDYTLLTNPLLNKGMAFSVEEREAFNILGHIPPHYETLDTQRERSYQIFLSLKDTINQYVYLRALQDTNETLFYSLLTKYITEMLPIVYTPVVGAGCQAFSKIYRRPRGLFIAYPNKNKIDLILQSRYFDQIKVIVVSDGERILGLGDQGAGGMGIPIGKLSLYSACAGVHPAFTLPILLDVGTNNLDLIHDPLYIGWKHERIRGKEYDDFIEAFVTAVKKRFPNVLLQWEDFAQQNANPILARYRDKLLTFNDDIQGTAAVATGTLLSAVRATGIPLHEQRIAVLGGGSAGCGISNLITQAMMADGLNEKEARSRFFIVDRNGLLVKGALGLMDFQTKFCQEKEIVANWSCPDKNNITLLDVIKNAHPSVLIGVSGQPGAFTENIVREMAAHVSQPIIFPLSNPTTRCEATPDDLISWTDNKVIVGTGSPFPPTMRNGVTTRIDQTNNSYIFPGMGLGLIPIQATYVSDNMFMAAAKALAACSPSINDPKANLLPPFDSIRDISLQVAIAVAKEAVASGYAPHKSNDEIEKIIRDNVWEPAYLPYKLKK